MPVTIGGSGPITGVTSINTSVSDTELGYLDGVTSAIQSQINTAGGLVKITDQSFTSASSVNVNNCFSSTYENYLIQIRALPSTATGVLARLRASGTDSSASYYFGETGRTAADAAANNAGANLSYWDLYGGINTFHNVILRQPAVSTAYTLGHVSFSVVGSGGLVAGGAGVLYHDVAAAYDGITVYPGSGTFTGTIRVYGYRN